MPNILVRNLEPETIERLKQRARRNRRSLQAEAKEILEDAATPAELTTDEFRRQAEAIRRTTAGRHQTDSVDLLREDRYG